MEYHGKLYGKIGNKHFDTGNTSKDFDEMFELLQRITDAIYTEDIIIKENIDNDGFENFASIFYQDSIKLISKITKK